MKITVDIKRVYEARTDQPEHGLRVLVDRIWPRGLARADVHFDVWSKDLAPSPELRKWFGHKPERWDDFRSRYETELGSDEQQSRLKELIKQANTPHMTLLYGARDTQHNHAVILAEELSKAAKSVRKPRSATQASPK